MQRRVKQIRITIEAVYDDGYVVQKVFSPKYGEEPEDAVEDFDDWIDSNMDLEEEDWNGDSTYRMQ